MKFGFFLGCIMPLRYPGIETATRLVMTKLGIELVELEGASCCPAPGVTRSFDQKTWLAVGARNLAIAERKGVDIVTVCNGCFGSLFEANHKLQDDSVRNEVNKLLEDTGLEYSGTINVRHFAELFYRDVGVEKISKLTEKKQENIKAAIHVGCHFTKPSKIKKTDDPERPVMLDELVQAVGAESVDYRNKNLCCGAGGGVRARIPEVALKMAKEKLDNIKNTDANCIVDICPFCHLQYDRGQKELGSDYNLPVLHLSQLYGLAFGINRSKLGLDAQAIPVKL